MKKNEVQTYCMNCPRFVAWFWSESCNDDGTRTCSMLFRCYQERPNGVDSYSEYRFGYDINVNEEERSHLFSPIGEGESFFVQVMALKDENLVQKISECAGKVEEPCYKIGDKSCKYCTERMVETWNKE